MAGLRRTEVVGRHLPDLLPSVGVVAKAPPGTAMDASAGRRCRGCCATGLARRARRRPHACPAPARCSGRGPGGEALAAAVAARERLGDAGDAVLERWNALPGRWRVVTVTSLAFVVCNMDKVNISVAVIPMGAELGWGPATAGVVQSAFFWGYALSQVPGGWLATRFGGDKVLPAGVALWSAATAALPLVAGSLPALCVARAAVGLGEGISPPAAVDLIARRVPPTERA